MSRPASLRPQRNFIGKNKKAGSKKLEIDYAQAEDRYYGSHRLSIDINFTSLRSLRLELADAERRGKLSKAKKIRREINAQLEAGLFIQGTFCGHCGLHLHRCKCQGTIDHNNQLATTQLIHRILDRK